jgi:hypothetical protein
MSFVSIVGVLEENLLLALNIFVSALANSMRRNNY